MLVLTSHVLLRVPERLKLQLEPALGDHPHSRMKVLQSQMQGLSSDETTRFAGKHTKNVRIDVR